MKDRHTPENDPEANSSEPHDWGTYNGRFTPKSLLRVSPDSHCIVNYLCYIPLGAHMWGTVLGGSGPSGSSPCFSSALSQHDGLRQPAVLWKLGSLIPPWGWACESGPPPLPKSLWLLSDLLWLLFTFKTDLDSHLNRILHGVICLGLRTLQERPKPLLCSPSLAKMCSDRLGESCLQTRRTWMSLAYATVWCHLGCNFLKTNL